MSLENGYYPLVTDECCDGNIDKEQRVTKQLNYTGLNVQSFDGYNDHAQNMLHFLAGSVCGALIVYGTINDPASLNVPDTSGRYPIFYAVMSGNFDMMMALLQLEPSTGVDNIGRTLLHCAMGPHFNHDIVNYLCSVGYKLNQPDNLGRTPVHLAAMHNLDTLAYLLRTYRSHINLDLRDLDGRTVLHCLAARCDIDDAIEDVLDYGADHRLKNKQGQTPLDVATQLDNKDASQQLATYIPVYQARAMTLLCCKKDPDSAVYHLLQNDIYDQNVLNLVLRYAI
jgi:ankyrin repeat protein